MAQPCSICQHEKRAEIDRAIQEGQTLASIGRQFDVKYGALKNHKNHIKAKVQRAAAKKERVIADDALKWLDEAHDVALRGALMAEKDHKPSVMVQYATSTAALVARILEVTDYKKLKERVDEIDRRLKGA